jgi:hypothetical protein
MYLSGTGTGQGSGEAKHAAFLPVPRSPHRSLLADTPRPGCARAAAGQLRPPERRGRMAGMARRAPAWGWTRAA